MGGGHPERGVCAERGATTPPPLGSATPSLSACATLSCTRRSRVLDCRQPGRAQLAPQRGAARYTRHTSAPFCSEILPPALRVRGSALTQVQQHNTRSHGGVAVCADVCCAVSCVSSRL